MPRKGVYSEIMRNIYLAYMARILCGNGLVWTYLSHEYRPKRSPLYLCASIYLDKKAREAHLHATIPQSDFWKM